VRWKERSGSLFGRRRRIGLVVAVVVLAMDQASKAWAVASLAGGTPVPLLGRYLTLRLIYNAGSAFSMGQQATWIFTVIAAIAVIALARWVWTARTTVGALVLGLLLCGALTHLLDRLLRAPDSVGARWSTSSTTTPGSSEARPTSRW
jgi:signal peptidase II